MHILNSTIKYQGSVNYYANGSNILSSNEKEAYIGKLTDYYHATSCLDCTTYHRKVQMKTSSTSIASETTEDRTRLDSTISSIPLSCSWSPSSRTFVAGAGGDEAAAASFFASCFLKREAISSFLFIVQLFYRVQTNHVAENHVPYVHIQ